MPCQQVFCKIVKNWDVSELSVVLYSSLSTNINIINTQEHCQKLNNGTGKLKNPMIILSRYP